MDDEGPVCVLVTSGSLRQAPSNSALVGAVARLASDTVVMSIYRGTTDSESGSEDHVCCNRGTLRCRA